MMINNNTNEVLLINNNTNEVLSITKRTGGLPFEPGRIEIKRSAGKKILKVSS